jgi:hypothetical protein
MVHDFLTILSFYYYSEALYSVADLASNIVFLHFRQSLVIACLSFIQLYLNPLQPRLFTFYVIFLCSFFLPQ